MIKIDISELEFNLEVTKTPDGLNYEVMCDSFFDDTFSIDGTITLYDTEIIVVYDNFPISVLVNIIITEPIVEQHMIKIDVIDENILLEELTDILEDE